MAYEPEFYGDEDDEQPSEKHCKFCGRENLTWEDDNGKWVLIDCSSGEIHRCKGRKMKPFNFNMEIK